MRISDWSSDVCSSDLSALGLSRCCLRACQDGSFIRRSKAYFLKNLLLKALVLVVDHCESWGLLAVAGLSRESSAAGAILRRLWPITVSTRDGPPIATTRRSGDTGEKRCRAACITATRPARTRK